MPRSRPSPYSPREAESQRLTLLRRLEILDTPPERAFEEIVRLASALAGTPIALVSLVDEDRQWFKAAAGLDVRETPRKHAFCDHAIRQSGVMWVEDATADPRFRHNPLVTGAPHIRFYAGAPITAEGQPLGTVCVISDAPRTYDPRLAAHLEMLASIASAECERRVILREMSEARRQVVEASEAKSRFVANMSHELRTPLNGIIGVAGVMEAGLTDPRHREMLQIVLHSARSLGVLLEDILDISRIEAGRLDLQLQVFRLSDIVRQAMDYFQLRAEEKGLVLRSEGVPEEHYLGDPLRLRQIVSNLIGNAVKFTEHGEVVVRVTRKPRPGGDQIAIAVSDTGPGFDAATAESLFHRFEQGDGSLTRKHGGVGLGLYISRSLAELMGGQLKARARPGKGACFTLNLALQQAEPEADARDAPPQQRVQLRAARVLVADDHPTNRKVAELILAATGAQVVSVADGLEAVRAFAEDTFDFVLMDVQMPNMDGLEAIRRIRATEAAHALGRTPIATFSAHAMPEHVRQSLSAGADQHLTKPLTADQLLGALAESIARRETSTPTAAHG